MAGPTPDLGGIDPQILRTGLDSEINVNLSWENLQIETGLDPNFIGSMRTFFGRQTWNYIDSTTGELRSPNFFLNRIIGILDFLYRTRIRRIQEDESECPRTRLQLYKILKERLKQLIRNQNTEPQESTATPFDEIINLLLEQCPRNNIEIITALECFSDFVTSTRDFIVSHSRFFNDDQSFALQKRVFRYLIEKMLVEVLKINPQTRNESAGADEESTNENRDRDPNETKNVINYDLIFQLIFINR